MRSKAPRRHHRHDVRRGNGELAAVTVESPLRAAFKRIRTLEARRPCHHQEPQRDQRTQSAAPEPAFVVRAIRQTCQKGWPKDALQVEIKRPADVTARRLERGPSSKCLKRSKLCGRVPRSLARELAKAKEKGPSVKCECQLPKEVYQWAEGIIRPMASRRN